MPLADELIKNGVLQNSRLIDAFRAVDRKKFVPDELEAFAYSDEPLPIGEGQTISQPWTVAFMLELLDPQLGENILEIGYGSGWVTTLMSYCGANVYAIERIPNLCKFGKNNVENFLSSKILRRDGIPFGAVQFFCQDGARGLPEIAKRSGEFDKIIVAAALKKHRVFSGMQILPQTWKEQLKIGGRIVVPIEHSIFLFIKKAHNQFDEREYSGFAFVPLVEEN